MLHTQKKLMVIFNTFLEMGVPKPLTPKQCVEQLEKDYSLRVKYYDDRVVLNYSQIDSPKNDPICNECRGLILALDFNFSVLSRGFDRFYNFNEVPGHTHDFSNTTIKEKLDGSFISIYFDDLDCKWQVATRGTAFAEATLPPPYQEVTFRELVLEGIGFTEKQFQDYCDHNLDMLLSHLCEITSTKNRVVTHYKETELYLLACRNIDTGEYEDYGPKTPQIFSEPRVFSFDSPTHCLEAANALKGLQEGYVVYDENGIPVFKIKSPTYVAVHHLRGSNTLCPKRLALLVINNEHKEYLTYFPEDFEYIEPYVSNLEHMLDSLDIEYMMLNQQFMNQKEFAMRVKDMAASALFFRARANTDALSFGLPSKEFHKQRDKYKVDLLLDFMDNC